MRYLTFICSVISIVIYINNKEQKLVACGMMINKEQKLVVDGNMAMVVACGQYEFVGNKF